MREKRWCMPRSPSATGLVDAGAAAAALSCAASARGRAVSAIVKKEARDFILGLQLRGGVDFVPIARIALGGQNSQPTPLPRPSMIDRRAFLHNAKIGRASCRE